MKSNPTKEKRTKKTYKERAEYLSFIRPDREEIFMAIAEFFGEDEIPPKIKSLTN